MRLTAYSNFALRVLQLSALRHPELTRTEQVATAHGISRAHVNKVVHELGRAGFLETHRGRGGGFRLARPADEIRVGDVLRATEGTGDLVECFQPGRSSCPLIGVCELSDALHRAERAFYAVLDDVSVADLSANREVLFQRLGTDLAPELPCAV